MLFSFSEEVPVLQTGDVALLQGADIGITQMWLKGEECFLHGSPIDKSG